MVRMDECALGDFTCVDSDDAFVVPSSKILFLSLVCLCIAAVIARNLSGGSSSRWRSIWTSLVLFEMCFIQIYFLAFAAMSAYPYASMTRSVYRFDCMRSIKGGKRAMNDKRPHTLNPCFCHANATCTLKGENTTVGSTSCPTNGKATCFEKSLSGKKIEIPIYVDEDRDCHRGQRAACTKTEPCMPCELEELWRFLPEQKASSKRCTTCSVYNDGDCNFVPGVGPYCLEHPWSKRKVVPCKRCCTEPALKNGSLLFWEGLCVG